MLSLNLNIVYDYVKYKSINIKFSLLRYITFRCIVISMQKRNISERMRKFANKKTCVFTEFLYCIFMGICISIDKGGTGTLSI